MHYVNQTLSVLWEALDSWTVCQTFSRCYVLGLSGTEIVRMKVCRLDACDVVKKKDLTGWFHWQEAVMCKAIGGKHPSKMPLKHCRQALNERYCLFTYKYRKVTELVILKCSSWSWQLYYIMSVLALNKKIKNSIYTSFLLKSLKTSLMIGNCFLLSVYCSFRSVGRICSLTTWVVKKGFEPGEMMNGVMILTWLLTF